MKPESWRPKSGRKQAAGKESTFVLRIHDKTGAPGGNGLPQAVQSLLRSPLLHSQTGEDLHIGSAHPSSHGVHTGARQTPMKSSARMYNPDA